MKADMSLSIVFWLHCSKGDQALGWIKHLETIVLFWRYINKI